MHVSRCYIVLLEIYCVFIRGNLRVIKIQLRDSPFHNRLLRFIIDTNCSIRIKIRAVKHLEKHRRSLSIIERYLTQVQSETTPLIG